MPQQFLIVNQKKPKMTKSLAQKKQALEVLIEQSILIDVDRKDELIAKISQMDEEAVDALGKFLALEVKTAKKFYHDNLGKLDSLDTKTN
jgi:hypothetical protein